MWENTAPGIAFPHIFCDGGPLQLSVVLVYVFGYPASVKSHEASTQIKTIYTCNK